MKSIRLLSCVLLFGAMAISGCLQGSPFPEIHRYPIFAATGPMNEIRAHHSATFLPSGQVLITGGDSDYDAAPSRSGELFDPVTQTFRLAGNTMTIGRGAHTSTLLSDGRVLIAGGTRSSFCCFTYTPVTSADLFDPETNEFTSTGNMQVARAAHTATRLLDGRILLTGGCDPVTATVEIYDPSVGLFAPTGSMARPRCEHTATLLDDGKVLIVGGQYASDSAELYDPAIGAFSPAGNLSNGYIKHTATKLQNGQILIAGGMLGTAAEIYDPKSNTFSTTGALSHARRDTTATLLQSGQVLVVGGGVLDRTTELYDPATGLFGAGDLTIDTRAWHTATILTSGEVLVTGGYLQSAEIYTP